MNSKMHRRALAIAGILLISGSWGATTWAGPRGSEFDLTLTPAAGGMEGVGTVRPQDPVAMLFANPSSLTQLEGSNAFTLGATYASPQLDAQGEPTDLFGGPAQFAPLTGNFEGQSRITELVAPHAAAIHRFSSRLVAGFGFTGVSGLGSDFRDVQGVPNIVADLKLFGGNMVVGYEVTPEWSVGATFTIGIGNLQAGLTESGGAVNNLGVGGSFGTTYDLGPVMLGAVYKFPLSIEYEHVIETAPDVFSDLRLEQPQELQLGVATTELLWKETLVEADFRYKNWTDADGYSSFWKDQFVISLGGQHRFATSFGNLIFRTGYSYGSNLAKDEEDLGNAFGDITQVKNPGPGPASLPVTPAFLQLAQATITDGWWRQSVSVGFGWEVPQFKNVRLDINASYAFDGEERFGRFKADGSLFTAGMGFTWGF